MILLTVEERESPDDEIGDLAKAFLALVGGHEERVLVGIILEPRRLVHKLKRNHSSAFHLLLDDNVTRSFQHCSCNALRQNLTRSSKEP